MLGVAIRLAQSMGLHIEPEASATSAMAMGTLPGPEARRRLWYSLYVLDRLLALQLGRPPAIHDDDFSVLMPSRLDDADIDWEKEDTRLVEPLGPSAGDYFLSVIQLSRIIGLVLRDLYGARRPLGATEEFPRTRLLDRQLLDWKAGLPRTLRFDFGHAFEASLVFKRQVEASYGWLLVARANGEIAQQPSHQVLPPPRAHPPAVPLPSRSPSRRCLDTSAAAGRLRAGGALRAHLRRRGAGDGAPAAQRGGREGAGARLPMVADDLVPVVCELGAGRGRRVCAVRGRGRVGRRGAPGRCRDVSQGL